MHQVGTVSIVNVVGNKACRTCIQWSNLTMFDHIYRCAFLEHWLLSLCFIAAFSVFHQKHHHSLIQLPLSASIVSAYAVYPAGCGFTHYSQWALQFATRTFFTIYWSD